MDCIISHAFLEFAFQSAANKLHKEIQNYLKCVKGEYKYFKIVDFLKK